MKVEVQKDWYSINQCKNNPNKLYIFGDNFIRKGYGGQAQIRDCQNSFGIATKFAPGTYEKDYFSDIMYDQCINIIKMDIDDLLQYLSTTSIIDTVIFPVDGLGTGLSELPTRAPKVYKFLNDELFKNFGIKL